MEIARASPYLYQQERRLTWPRRLTGKDDEEVPKCQEVKFFKIREIVGYPTIYHDFLRPLYDLPRPFYDFLRLSTTYHDLSRLTTTSLRSSVYDFMSGKNPEDFQKSMARAIDFWGRPRSCTKSGRFLSRLYTTRYDLLRLPTTIYDYIMPMYDSKNKS